MSESSSVHLGDSHVQWWACKPGNKRSVRECETCTIAASAETRTARTSRAKQVVRHVCAPASLLQNSYHAKCVDHLFHRAPSSESLLSVVHANCGQGRRIGA